MQTSMNPSTLLRMWEPFAESNGKYPIHILEIAGMAGTWPGTIYKAERLGYLKYTSRAHFKPTAKFRKEIDQIHKRMREKNIRAVG